MKRTKMILLMATLLVLLAGVASATDASEDTSFTYTLESVGMDAPAPEEVTVVQEKSTPTVDVEENIAEQKSNENIQEQKNLKTGSTSIEVNNFNELNATLNDQYDSVTLNINSNITLIHTPTINTRIRNLTINGKGYTIDGNGTNQFLTIPSGINVTLYNLTLTNCYLIGSGSNVIRHPGGVIYNEGTLTINNCIFTNNNAIYGGAIYNKGTLTVTGTQFNNNNARSGGAIYNGGILTVTGTQFNNNNAEQYGGAIINSGTLTVAGTQFNSNHATNGGAIFKISTIEEITNTVFYNNTPSNFIIDQRTGKIKLEKTDDYITVGNFTIIVDGVEKFKGYGSEQLNSYDIQGDNPLVKLVVNGTDSKTTNNEYIISDTINAKGYQGLIDAINKAKQIQHIHVLINLQKEGNYNATTSIDWNNSATNNITIRGNGLTLNGNKEYQFIQIAEGHNLALENIIITNYTALYGGAINNNGTLTVTNTQFNNNNATSGGAIYNGGTLTVTGTQFNNNNATSGGAIFNNGTLIVTGTQFNNNNATSGGAIYNKHNYTLTVTDTQFNNNNATSGGAIFNNGTLTVTGTQFNNNNATSGGAIYNDQSTIKEIINTVFYNNTPLNFIINQDNHIELKNMDSYITVGEFAILVDDVVVGSGTSTSAFDNIDIPQGNNIKLIFNGTNTINCVYLLKNVKTGSISIEVNNFNELNAAIGKDYYDSVTLNINSNITLLQTPTINTGIRNLTINGKGYAIDGNGKNQFLTIPSGINVTLDNLTLTNCLSIVETYESGGDIIIVIGNMVGIIDNQGTLTINNCIFTNNKAIYGGAIENYGTLTVSNTIFQDNNATSGGAIYNGGILTVTGTQFNNNQITRPPTKPTTPTSPTSPTLKLNGYGGAIYNGGTLTVTGTQFNNNKATVYDGGAIYNNGTLTVTDTQFNNNEATSGGAIYNGGTLTVNNTVFYNNNANHGGVIYNNQAALTVNNTTFQDNNAKYGGVIYNKMSTLTVTNTQFTNNYATIDGGAIYSLGTIKEITDTVFYKNDPLNFIINQDNHIELKNTDEYISVGEFAIIVDDVAIGSGTGTDDFNNIDIPQGDNIKLIFNGTNMINSVYLLRSNNRDVKGYPALISAIEEARQDEYNKFIINLHPGNYNATASICWNNSATKNIIINGNGLTLNGKNTYQFIKIAEGHNLTLKNIIITNYTAEKGGAIYNYGNLTITDSTLTNNHATAIGEEEDSHGGAIYNTEDNYNYNITGTTFYKNTPENFFINSENKIRLICDDNYISIGKFTIIADGKEIGTGTSVDDLARFTILDEYNNLELVINGSDDKTLNNRYMLRGFSVEVHNYTELVEAIEKAQSENYNSYLISLQEGDYNATKSINWEESATENLIIKGNGLTLDGKQEHQFIQIGSRLSLTLDNITITNYTAEKGGAIINRGILTVKNTQFSNNKATSGGAIANYGTIKEITNTIFYNNTPANFIINQTRNIQLEKTDDYITIGNFTIIEDGVEKFKGYGSEQLNNYAISEGNHLVKIIINGTNTTNNEYILSNTIDVKDYQGLIDAIEAAGEYPYNLFTINLLTGKYNATDRIYWIDSPTKNIIINGNGLTLDGQDAYQFIYISEGHYLTIENITIRNYTDSSGGVFYNEGTLTLNYCILENNKAASGGAIYNRHGTLIITDTTLSYNNATFGGAIYDDYGDVTINQSKLYYNSATSQGGAIFTASDTFKIYNTEFYHNDEKTFTINHENHVEKIYDKSITVGDFTIMADNQTYHGSGLDALTNYNIPAEALNIKLILNGSNEYTRNNVFILRNSKEINITSYPELIDAIKEAESEEYYVYIINLDEGAYNAIANITWNNSATPKIIINGNGQTLDGQDKYQFITIAEGHNLTLENTTITNYVATNGGAIYNNGNITITNSTLQDNQAYDGGAIYNNGNLTITNSTLNNNKAINNGAAIYNHATANITGNYFITNTAGQAGNAIIDEANAEIRDNINDDTSRFSSTIFTNADNVWIIANTFIDEHNTSIIISTNNTNPKINDKLNITFTLLDQFGFEIPDQVINITINNEKYNITTDEYGTGSLEYTIKINETIVTATYHGNETYNQNTTTLLITAQKLNTKISVADVNTKVGQACTITGTLLDENNNPIPEATVYITVNSTTNTTTTNNFGRFNLTVTLNQMGEYPITVVFHGTGVYNQSTNSTAKVTATRTDTKLTITVSNMSPVLNNSISVTVTLTDTNGNKLSGQNVTITITGKTYTVKTGSNGMVTQTCTPTAVGKQTITVKYNGDSRYNNSTAAINITVGKINTKLTLNVSNSTPQVTDTITITAILTDTNGNRLSNQNITLTVESKTYTIKTNSNGQVTQAHKLTKAGATNITAKYSGNVNYNSSTTSARITVNMLNSSITITANNTKPRVNDKVKLTITLKDSNNRAMTNKTVTVTVNNRNYNVTTDNAGTAFVSYTMNKNYANLTAVASYAGDSTYRASNKTLVLNRTYTTDVKLLTGSFDAKPGDTVKLIAHITDNGLDINGGQLVFKINGKTLADENGTAVKVSIRNGFAILEYRIPDTLSAGTRNLSASFSSGKYSGRLSTPMIINRLQTHIDVNPLYTTNNTIIVKAQVVDQNNQALNKQTTICIKFNGKSYNFNTTTGTINYQINQALNNGYYNLTIICGANGKYLTTTANTVLIKSSTAIKTDYINNTLNNKTTANSGDVKTGTIMSLLTGASTVKPGDTLKLIAHVTKDSVDITGGQLGFKIDGLTLNDSENNKVFNPKDGLAILEYKVPDTLSAGTRTLSAVYSSKQYGTERLNSTLTMNKLNTHIEAQPLYTTSYTPTIQAQILDDNNQLINKETNIVIKIDGKSYSIKNSDGIINYKVPTSLSKGLHQITIITGENGKYLSSRVNTVIIRT